MRSIIGIGLLGVISLSSCVFLDDSFHLKTIHSFSLRTSDNPRLRREYTAEVLAGKIRMNVPNYVDARNLVPHIEWEGVALEVNGSPYIDSETRDFLQPMTVRVIGKDNEPLDYKVEVDIVPPLTAKALTRMSLRGTSEYQVWPTFTNLTAENVLELPPARYYYPWHLDVANLGLELGISGIQVELDGTPYQNDSRRFDFTTPHTFRVTAEDLNTQDYTVKVQYEIALSIQLYYNNSPVWSGELRGKDAATQVQVSSAVPRDQLRMYLFNECPYPVTDGQGRLIAEEQWIAVDLSHPLELTGTGPYKSVTHVFSVIP